MELVYLWVEEYKNIRNQGFNFSPRFECIFDENTKELTITENQNYVSIFPENINVTAIVGENGTGKSSISELLVDFSYQEFHDEKTFLVFFDNNTFLFKQSYTNKKVDFSIINHTRYADNDYNVSRIISCIYFSNDVATLFNNPKFHNHQVYSNLDAYYNYDTNLMENNKYPYASREQTNKLETFNTRFKTLLEKDKNILIDISKNLIFNSFTRELHFYELGAYFAINNDNKSLLKLLNIEKLEGTIIFSDLNIDKEIHFYKLLILFRLFKLQKEVREKIINTIEKDFNKNDFDLALCLQILEKFNQYDMLENIYSEKNIKDVLNKYKYHKDEIWIEKKVHNIQDNFETSNELLNIVLESGISRTNFLNKQHPEYNYFSLSSGEREYIKTFVALIHHLKKESQEFIFIFDEIELGLHPNWQKNLIKDFVNIVSKYIKKNMNFIFTSHSPFILSDIPKENVIFLEKYKKDEDRNQKEGNCKNATKNIELKTFGANIHTLLSNGFFMSDGLMGEFAKNKINNVIKKLKDKNYNPSKNEKENILATIKIIGEDFLRTKLLDIYYKKFDDDFIKKQRKEELLEEQEKIKKELENL